MLICRFLLTQMLAEGAYSTISLGYQCDFDEVKGWQQNGDLVVIKSV